MKLRIRDTLIVFFLPTAADNIKSVSVVKFLFAKLRQPVFSGTSGGKLIFNLEQIAITNVLHEL